MGARPHHTERICTQTIVRNGHDADFARFIDISKVHCRALGNGDVQDVLRNGVNAVRRIFPALHTCEQTLTFGFFNQDIITIDSAGLQIYW